MKRPTKKGGKKSKSIIRLVYLYLVTAISIVLILIASIGFVHLILEEYVFNVVSYEMTQPYYECGEDYSYDLREPVPVSVKDSKESKVEMTEEEKAECIKEVDEDREFRHMNDLKRDIVTWLSMLIVALPLYLYHWGIIKREK